MSTADQDKWNAKYAQRETPAQIEPDEWLLDALAIITESTGKAHDNRRALDVACGLGDNAIELSRQGWQVDGIDISESGLELARSSATNHGCDVNWLVADLDEWLPESGAYGLAIVFRFLNRDTVPDVVRTALTSGGWLIYETFSAEQLKRPDSHIRNPAFALKPGELIKLFPEFDVIHHREDVLEDRTVERFLARTH